MRAYMDPRLNCAAAFPCSASGRNIRSAVA